MTQRDNQDKQQPLANSNKYQVNKINKRFVLMMIDIPLHHMDYIVFERKAVGLNLEHKENNSLNPLYSKRFPRRNPNKPIDPSLDSLSPINNPNKWKPLVRIQMY